MAKVDDLLQSGSKQIVLAVVAWLAHGCPPDSESRRRRNHEPPKSGIPKRKKTATHNRLSCKIEYLLRSNHGHSSIASEFFTGDQVSQRQGPDRFIPFRIIPDVIHLNSSRDWTGGSHSLRRFRSLNASTNTWLHRDALHANIASHK